MPDAGREQRCPEPGCPWEAGHHPDATAHYNEGREQSCAYCRQPIRWESSEYAKRWVHEASGIPMCTATVATPVVSAPACFCGQPDERERVHRANACEPWVSRG